MLAYHPLGVYLMIIKRITNAGDIISRNEGTALASVTVIINADQ